MDATTLKILSAGLLHDLGKFVDREALNLDSGYIREHENIFLPKHGGRYSHYHALYSGAFLEVMRDYLPPEFNSRAWGDGDTLFNLVAGHHRPSTPLQWIIAVADRLSSEMDRDTFSDTASGGIPVASYKKTRLLPIFEQLLCEERDYTSLDDFKYCYKLDILSPESIFPVEKNVLEHDSKESASEQYAGLSRQFLESLKLLMHRDKDVSLWLEHFDSSLMAHASSIPSARVGTVVPDVSLYDHSRLTAAFAGPLYLYHRETGSLEERAIRDANEEKFLIISGDLYGIQSFIFTGYGDTRKHRSKLLRGRSLYVSLLSELAADMICRNIGLHDLVTLLSAAGKFMIIAPNTSRVLEAVKESEEKINDWLTQTTYGETSIGISSLKASQSDFAKGKFEKLWDKVCQSMEGKKYARIDLARWGGAVGNYLDSFQNDLSSPLCPICGKRPSAGEVERDPYLEETHSACGMCRDQIFLGTKIVKNEHMAVLKSENEKLARNASLALPIYDRYQITFPSEAPVQDSHDNYLLRLWDIAAWKKERLTSKITVKMINGYVPVYDSEDENDGRILWSKKSDNKKLEQIDQIDIGAPKTFAHLAAKAFIPLDADRYTGVEALGILKADVDNLGMIMGAGLKGDRFTISRLATLSRQMNLFFAYFLPTYLNKSAEYKDVYTVFAGGDDLFLIGPWNRMLKLGKDIASEFQRYTCLNPSIHLSAGIIFCKPNIPLDTISRKAEEALEASKTAKKNRVCVFGEVLPWDEVTGLEEIESTIEKWLHDGLISKSMLYKLNELVAMANYEKSLLEKKEFSIEEMNSTKWRALLAYFAGRNVGKNVSRESREEEVKKVTFNLVSWLEKYRGWLRVPLWNILYNHR